MVLCLDVGNTQICGGIFSDGILKFQFRKNSSANVSSDEYGLFLRTVLRENGFDPKAISKISICTVVPGVLYSLKNACKKYFDVKPFVLQAGVKTGLKIKYRNPVEDGADRIANAIAATQKYPNQNLIVVDFGTAITLCAINAESEYLGGVILPGLKLSMSSLEDNTAKLPSVEIIAPKKCLGRSTVESIQSGLYFGAKGAVAEVIRHLIEEAFGGKSPKIIGTGGFTQLFRKTNLFDEEASDLVLQGLYHAIKLNV